MTLPVVPTVALPSVLPISSKDLENELSISFSKTGIEDFVLFGSELPPLLLILPCREDHERFNEQDEIEFLKRGLIVF